MPSTDGEPSAGVRNLTNKETTMRQTIAMALAAVAITVHAQSTTYNHDPMKMNQITVMESGSGQLQPDWYYSLLHENYSKGAASTNKAMYRTEAGGVLYLQLPTGDSIKTYLEKRAEIEALNMADRAGGAADLAWMAEGEKIERKMEAFKTNVERIVPTGGTGDERSYWLQYYDMFQTAIRNTQDAYMPNAQRKREYLQIYADVARKNDLLLKYLVKIHQRRQMDERNEARMIPRSETQATALAALTRWQGAVGMTGGRGSIEE